MKLKAEVKFINQERTSMDIREKCTTIVKNHINKVLKQYAGKDHEDISRRMRNDIIDEYVAVLSSYSYSDAERRDNMTRLIMQARGRDPNPEGSYKEEEAEDWVRKSTTTAMRTKIPAVKERRKIQSSYKFKAIYVGSLIFWTASTVVNRVLANLEKGRVSWYGKNPYNIAKWLKRLADEGLVLGRIKPEERLEIYRYANSPELFVLETVERPYFETAVEKTTALYGKKWIDMVKKDIIKYLRVINFPKTMITIPRGKTKVKVLGEEFNEYLNKLARSIPNE